MCQLAKRGLATAVICSDAYAALAKTQARVFGVPELPLLIVPHPVGGLAAQQVQQRALMLMPQLLQLIGMAAQ